LVTQRDEILVAQDEEVEIQWRYGWFGEGDREISSSDGARRTPISPPVMPVKPEEEGILCRDDLLKSMCQNPNCYW